MNVRGKLIDMSSPMVMGIMNLTPDSFYDGGRLKSDSDLLHQAEKHLRDGATFIDVGGYSSRPGADDISEREELSRVIKPVELIVKEFPDAIVSVDTFRSVVASKALEAGAHIINDISGGGLDENMFETVGHYNCPYIMMHMQGNPQNMKDLTKYDDILGELVDYFVLRVNQLRELGVKDIIVDPGFGFSKSIDQNYFLLRNLRYFQQLGLPILAGISRKSMIYKKLGITSQEALNGTTVLNTIALTNGSSILRVHDVKEAIETIKLYKYTYG